MNATPDMTIEKLHKVSTATVAPRFKAKWLHWWNSPLTVRGANKFPSTSPVKEKTLDSWLNKASFWAQVLQVSLIPFIAFTKLVPTADNLVTFNLLILTSWSFIAA